jgi:Ca2+-binding RTX toxin-like protein
MPTTIIGSQNSDFISGSNQDDIIYSNNGNDSIAASRGNDFIDGGDGFDTVDYSTLGTAITLGAFGVINKGVFGNDVITRVERIVGAVNQANSIDASSSTGITSVNVNLSSGSLTVNNIPFLGNRSFSVINFVNATGTNSNDTFTGSIGNNLLRGLGGNDIFHSTAGNDTIDGGTGFDIADYRYLNSAITLKPTGIIDKGSVGQDNLISIERIIGAVNQANTIDASSATGTTTLDVNLAGQSVAVNIPFIGLRSFAIENFVNAIGANNNDVFTGSSSNNVLRGLGGNDTFNATAGNDTIDGGDGFDIVNYGALGRAITIRPAGVIDKGFGEQDSLIGIEQIEGAIGQANVIDSSGTTGVTSINVNLNNRSLTVNNIPFLGNRSFTVTNFVNAIGTNNADSFTGSAGNNILRGLDGNDFFHATTGNDTMDGGNGSDIADYRYLNSAITLKPTGIIDKGAAGQDTLVSIERIIGSVNQANTIDASSATGTTTLNVNLSGQSLAVNIPFIGLRSFAIENFVNAIGANNDDIFTGSSGNNLLRGLGGNDLFNATNGNDTIDGGDGFDTANYSSLGRAVTIRPAGVVDKGLGQQDNLVNVENIIGAAGQTNTIDASSTTGLSSVSINLASNFLGVNNIPFLGNRNFTVTNFVNATGTNNADSFTGSAGNNILRGLDGNDFFHATTGNDTIDGGNGSDIADYRYLNSAITLKPTGIIDKGAAGQDTLVSIERIIGSVNQANTIDASSATGTTTLNVNLSGQSLAVNIPFIGLRSFTIENFVNAIGANNNDVFTGSSGNNILRGLGGNDIFNATGGNDTIDGGDGFDTANYSSLGRAVTIRPAGTIDKGFGQQDNLIGVENIIGAVGQANAIDASTTTGITSLNVQLTQNQLRVVDIPGLGARSFTISNFNTVTGTQNADSLDGDSAANTFNGAAGNDELYGRGGNDILSGGSGNDFIHGDEGNDRLVGTDSWGRGRGEIDNLFGGSGNDRLVLGDRFGSYYKGYGSGDFTSINDFVSGDLIELGLNESYRIVTKGSSSFDLFVVTGGSNELIAKVNGTMGIGIPSGTFTIASGQVLGSFIGA